MASAAAAAAAAVAANQHRRAHSRPLNYDHPLESASTQPRRSAGPFGEFQQNGQPAWQLGSGGSSSPTSKPKSLHSRDKSSQRSREGHQFRVGNIGNNGLLYLRPIERANQTYHVQSPPMTPPLSTGSPPDMGRQDDADWRDSLLTDSNTLWSSGLRFSSADPVNLAQPSAPDRALQQDIRKAERDTPPYNDQANEVKIVINRASSPPKHHKSAIDSIPDARNMLGVTIPHYRLGTPRFTGTGSAILRSSINTGTATSDVDLSDEIRSSILTSNSFSIRGFPDPPGRLRRYSASEVSAPQDPGLDGAASLRQRHHSSQMVPTTGRAHGRVVSTTSVWEDDDPFMVQLSPVTGQVVVATPSGLIAQITSPNLLDYELLSDFFLTYRAFLTPDDLAACLINRLQWAVQRDDDFGRVVRVRTFVAIRHWILNYFVEDFVPSLRLRRQFCDLVNDLCRQVRSRSDAGGSDIKILGELKRCWRRTCALYWDIPDQQNATVDDDLSPGGQLGTRSSPMLSTDAFGDNRAPGDTLASSTRAAGAAVAALSRNPAPERMAQVTHRPSRGTTRVPRTTSDQSAIDVMSCALPKPSFQKAAAPAPPPSAADQAKLANKKPARPQHGRSNSFSDSMRDNRAPLSMSKSAGQDQADVASQAFPFPGVLVRGGLYQPPSPYVDSIAPGSPLDEDSSFDFTVPSDTAPSSSEERSNNNGMQSLFGTMRRALSTKRRPPPPPLQLRENEPPRRKSNGSTEPKTSGSYSRGRPLKRKLLGGQAHLRVDLLSAEVMESFKNALKDGNATNRKASGPPALGPSQLNTKVLQRDTYLRPLDTTKLHSDVTMGSRSIVIVDDTGENTPAFDPQDPMSNSYVANTTPSERSFKRMRGDPSSVNTIGLATPLAPEETGSRSRKSGGYAQNPSDVRDFVQHQPPRGPGLMYLRPYGTNEASDGGDVTQKSADQQSAVSEVSKTSTNDPFYLERLPVRQIRRRPGGDLRAADHVHSLEYHQPAIELSEDNLHKHEKSHSRGGTSPPPPPPTTATTTQGAQSRNRLSMMDTHSSQPGMRPSFENEVAKLAQIGDEDSDDGGIESTLAKLEGKHSKTPVTPTFPEGLFALMEGQRGSPTASEASWAKLRRNEKGLGRIHDGQPQSPPPPPPINHSPRSQNSKGKARSSSSGKAFSIKPTVNVGPAPTEELPAPPLTGTSLPSLITTEREMSSPESELETSNWGWLKVSLPSSREGPPSRSKLTQFQDSSSPITNHYENSHTRHSIVRLDSESPVLPSSAANTRNTIATTKQSMSERSHQSFLLNEDESLASATPTYGYPGQRGIASWYIENSAQGSFVDNDDDEDDEDDDDDDDSDGADGIGLAITTSAPDEAFPEPSPADARKFPYERTSPLQGITSTHNMAAVSGPSLPSPTTPRHIPLQDRVDHYAVEATSRPFRKHSNLLAPAPILVTSAAAPTTTTATTDTTPTAATTTSVSAAAAAAAATADDEGERRPSMSNTPVGAHLPWILAHDSRLIAQQLTLVEKDALSEIDWRELIEIQWKQTTTPYYNWVDYIRSDTSSPASLSPISAPASASVSAFATTAATTKTMPRPRYGGVDICIARFNLMVKWAISEIMLTQDTGERVATLVKYIHIAQHCRHLRNWATMYQITMALIHSDVARLRHSWAAVPDAERSTLKDLEQLILPLRNFQNLRNEMESAQVSGALMASAHNGKGGCIPFIGIYTHDLIFNAQKPAFIDKKTKTSAAAVNGGSGISGGEGTAEAEGEGEGEGPATAAATATSQRRGDDSSGEKLVNFERHHTAASIVKNMLRMLDESAKYAFQPVPDVLSKCLWMCALKDEDIRARSRALES